MHQFKCFFYLWLLLLSCTAKVPLYTPYEPGRVRSEFAATASQGMVSAAHPLASEAGAQMLRMGGNAIDAATAASFAISVVKPQSTGLGGGGFMLYFDAKSRKTMVYDFRERAPQRATRHMFVDAAGNPRAFSYNGQSIPDASVNGHLSVGVPGLVAGLIQTHKQFGKLPLETVLAPAIAYAENGIVVYRRLADAINDRKDILKHFEGSRALYLPQGEPLKIGDRLIQKDMAWTLREIGKGGVDAFYRGAIGKKIIAEMQRGGGLVSMNDLARYQVRNAAPVTGTYRQHRIYSMPPPSSGGVHIVEMLNMLEGFDLKNAGYNSAEYTHILSEVMRRAFADRAAFLGDPKFTKIPIKGLTSKAYAAKLRSTINADKAESSQKIGAGNPAAYESSSTSHISVVDAQGNSVSTTQTINYTFGSCVVAAGTGIMLNDEMDDFSMKPGVPNAYGLVGSEANAIAAGKTMLSSMTPSFVLDANGNIKLIVGAAGGPRIITSVLQVMLNVIDHDMELDDAVHALRIHHQWLPDKIRYEEGALDEATAEKLKQWGHTIEATDQIGTVQAIARSGSQWIGVSDTRDSGKPVGY